MAALTGRTALVTGAFGNVGRYVLRRLAEETGAVGSVVATDLAGDRSRELARQWVSEATPGQTRTVQWADLTDAAEVAELVSDVDPDVVLHLAAVIPPAAYRDPELARRVNVDATGHLAAAVSVQAEPARLVFASSMATFGSRNPHTVAAEPATAETPARPVEVYGAQKVEAEELLRERLTDVVVLRLGAVLFPEASMPADPDTLAMTAQTPSDGHLHGVDARDAATALVRAADADCAGRTLLIGGDRSWMQEQDELMQGVTAATGMRGVLPANLPGDPDDDTAWFCVDWMDTSESQHLLGFQQHTWDEYCDDVRSAAGWRRWVMPAVSPLARRGLALTPAFRRRRGPYAPMWRAVAQRWGEQALAPGR